MKKEQEIKSMIEEIDKSMEEQSELGNHDEEFYANYCGRKEALQWVLNEEELEKHRFMKAKKDGEQKVKFSSYKIKGRLN